MKKKEQEEWFRQSGAINHVYTVPKLPIPVTQEKEDVGLSTSV